MELVTVVLFDSSSEFKHSLYVAMHEMDVVDEDFHYCVMREKGHELLRLRREGAPYIAVCKASTLSSDEQRDINEKYSILESNFELNSVNLSECRVLCRGFEAYNGIFGMEPLISKEDDEKVKRWTEIIDKNDIGREIFICSQKTVADRLFGKDDTPFFLKTLDKGSHQNTVNFVIDSTTKSRIILTKDRPDLDRKSLSMHAYLSKDSESLLTLFKESYSTFNPWHGEMERYPECYFSIDGEMMISDVMSIKEDEHGKVEYRVFVVDGKVSSISRYLDYVKVEIPESIVQVASSFAKKYKAELPKFYVVDFAETSNGIELIELNPYQRSGRYYQNSASNLARDILSLSDRSIKVSSDNLFNPKLRKKLRLDDISIEI